MDLSPMLHAACRFGYDPVEACRLLIQLEFHNRLLLCNLLTA